MRHARWSRRQSNHRFGWSPQHPTRTENHLLTTFCTFEGWKNPLLSNVAVYCICPDFLLAVASQTTEAINSKWTKPQGDEMKMRVSSAGTSVAVAIVVSGWVVANIHHAAAAGAAPPPSVLTFSTAEIGRQGHFYVGGHYVGEPGKEIMDGAMYVEVWVPKTIRHPYPMVFISGGGGQGAY